MVNPPTPSSMLEPIFPDWTHYSPCNFPHCPSRTTRLPFSSCDRSAFEECHRGSLPVVPSAAPGSESERWESIHWSPVSRCFAHNQLDSQPSWPDQNTFLQQGDKFHPSCGVDAVGLWFLCVISLETPRGREGKIERQSYRKTRSLSQ